MSRTIRPWFTFFGFRYIKITSSIPIDPALFVGRAVYSEMERTGFISTSHEKLNRLYENCLYRTLADQIKASILQEFYSPSGRLTVDTQTGYLLALNFQVHHSREKILEGLKQRLERDNYRIRTGFVGTALMPTVFGDNDMVDEFYDFLFYEGFPGCFSYTYMPKRDYRTPFNEHTRLEILAEHKAAVEVLKEYLPRKYEAICTGNVDELSCTLADELRKTQKVGYPPERLDSIERAVVDMFCFPEADLQNAISAIKQIKVEV